MKLYGDMYGMHGMYMLTACYATRVLGYAVVCDAAHCTGAVLGPSLHASHREMAPRQGPLRSALRRTTQWPR
eukprot:7364053-Pyramimonas_sp.AAC.1